MPHFGKRVEITPRKGLARAFSRSGDRAKVLQEATKGFVNTLAKKVR